MENSIRKKQNEEKAQGRSKACCLIQDELGRRMIVRWVDLVEVHQHRDIQDAVFLDLVFREWNVLVLGRNIEKLLPLIQDRTTDLVVRTNGPLEIEMVRVFPGQGCSVFGEGRHSMEAPRKDTWGSEESDPVIEGGFIQDGFDEGRIRQILR